MAKTLTLEISDTIYETLIQVASQVGQTPEQVILHWIENRIDAPDDDPLLALAGVFEAPVTDISDLHDHYIGSASEQEIQTSTASG
ncbi:MAG: hypothetical protein KDJ65_16805 [Anaerolineae bacterium]|nr:hypothetical protein [Anaerolineae bacterium]